MSSTSIIRLSHHHQEHSTSCLAACVVMVVSCWQTSVTEAEARRLLKTKLSSGTHPVNLLHLSEWGFLAWLFEGTVHDLRQRVRNGIPVIVFLWTGALSSWTERKGVDYFHTVVVVGWTETAVWVHDPALSDGPTTISWGEFTEAWRYSRQMMATIEPRETS